MFYGWWRCWRPVTSLTMVATLAAILDFPRIGNQVKSAKNGSFFVLDKSCKITYKWALCIISSTSITYIVERSWKNMHFHSKMDLDSSDFKSSESFFEKHSPDQKSGFGFAERHAKSVLRFGIRFWIHRKEHTLSCQPWLLRQEINNMDRNQPITTYRSDLAIWTRWRKPVSWEVR